MAYLTVESTSVTVAMNRTVREKVEIGDRDRAFDGSMRSTIRETKREWEITTTPLPRATANSLESTLEGTPPLSCSGDLLGGTVNCHAEITGWQSMRFAGAEYAVLTFRLMEV